MQFTEQEKEEMRRAKESGTNLSQELADKVESFLADDAATSGDTICCKYWSSGWKYEKCTKSSCLQVGGEVVSDSNC